MSERQDPPSDNKLAVLSLTRNLAEWVELDRAGNPSYGRAEVEGLAPADLSRAAVAARRASGGRQRACVLALGDDLARQRIVRLPRLSKREMSRVLLRKAAQLLECDPDDALYTCAPITPEAEGDGEVALLLTAMRRSLVSRLRVQLRKRRFHVRRVSSAVLSPLGRARAACDDPDAPTVVVVVQPRSVGVSLVANSEIVHHDRLEGDFFAVPALAASVLQTVRTSAAYWRKVHRGGEVASVVVLGLPPRRGALLRQAIETALPGVAARVLPEAATLAGQELAPDASEAPASPLGLAVDMGPEPEAPESGEGPRIEVMRSYAARGPVPADLTTRAPMRAAAAITLATLAFGLTAAVAGFGHQHFAGELESLEGELSELETQCRDLGELQNHNRLAQQHVAVLQRKIERAHAIGGAGVAYDAFLADVLRILGGRAQLVSVSVGRSFEAGRDVAVRMRITREPVSSTLALREIREGFEALEGIFEVAVDLPTSVDASLNEGADATGFEVTLTAKLEEAS